MAPERARGCPSKMEAANAAASEPCATHRRLLRHALYGEGAEFRILVADRGAKFLELRRIAVSLEFLHAVPDRERNALFGRVSFNSGNVLARSEAVSAVRPDKRLSLRRVLFRVGVEV